MTVLWIGALKLVAAEPAPEGVREPARTVTDGMAQPAILAPVIGGVRGLGQ